MTYGHTDIPSYRGASLLKNAIVGAFKLETNNQILVVLQVNMLYSKF